MHLKLRFLLKKNVGLNRLLIIFLYFFLGINCDLLAQIQATEAIKNLKEEWLIYDQGSQTYLPYYENFFENTHAISFNIDLRLFKNYQLYLGVPSNSTIFYNQRLSNLYLSDTIMILDIDSISTLYNEKELFVTIYNPEQSVTNSNTYIIYEKGLTDATQVAAELINVIPRNNYQGLNDFFVLGLIIILIIYTILLNSFTRHFKSFYDLTRTLSLNIREEYTFKGRAFNTTNIIILAAHSILLAFLGIIILTYGLSGSSDINSFTVGKMLPKWLFYSAVLFIALISKYWLVATIGTLFNLRDIINRHYLEYIRMSKVFFAIILLIFIIALLGFEINIFITNNFVKNLIIVFFIIRVLLLYLKFMRSASIKNLYLFSYLCTTEIIPLVIGLKYFTNID